MGPRAFKDGGLHCLVCLLLGQVLWEQTELVQDFLELNLPALCAADGGDMKRRPLGVCVPSPLFVCAESRSQRVGESTGADLDGSGTTGSGVKLMA